MPFPRGTHRVGRFLWAARRASLGWSLSELSTRSGVNRGDLSYYENGRKNVPTAVFEKVMAALDAAPSGVAGPGDTNGDVVNPGTADGSEPLQGPPPGLATPDPIA